MYTTSILVYATLLSGRAAKLCSPFKRASNDGVVLSPYKSIPKENTRGTHIPVYYTRGVLKELRARDTSPHYTLAVFTPRVKRK